MILSRAFACLVVAIGIAGCATPPIPPSPNPNWTRVSGNEAKCVAYAPRRREPVDINIILKPEFQSSLEEQLDAQKRAAFKCWYETPTGAIRLFTGDFCGEGVDSFFEQTADGWKLMKSDDIFANCRTIEH